MCDITLPAAFEELVHAPPSNNFNINIELVCKDLGDSEVTANIEDLLSLDFANDDEEQVSPPRYIR